MTGDPEAEVLIRVREPFVAASAGRDGYQSLSVLRVVREDALGRDVIPRHVIGAAAIGAPQRSALARCHVNRKVSGYRRSGSTALQPRGSCTRRGWLQSPQPSPRANDAA